MTTKRLPLLLALFFPGSLSAQEAEIPAPRGILEGHTGRVMHVAFLPDGKALVSSCYGKKLLLWDVENAKVTGELKGHRAVIMTLAASPDGAAVATSGQYDSFVSFWDVEKKKLASSGSAHAPYGASALEFSPDGKTLVSGGSSTLCVWQLDKQWRIKDTFNIPKNQNVSRVALSPDGKLLAWGGFGHRINLWEPETGKKVGLFYSPDMKNSTSGLAFRSDGKILAVAHNSIHLWDFTGGDLPIASMHGHEGYIHALAFRPKSNLLVSAGQDKTVRLWDIGTQKSLATLDVGTPAVCLTISPDGNTLAVGCEDKKIRVYDISSVKVPIDKVAGVSGKKLEIPLETIKATIQGIYAEQDQIVLERDDHRGPWALHPKSMEIGLKANGKNAAIKDLRARDKVEIIISKLDQRVVEIRLLERNEALSKRFEELLDILKKNYAEDTFPRKILSPVERQKRDELTLAQTKKLLDADAKDDVAFDICRWMLNTKNPDLQNQGAELIFEHHLKNARIHELLPKALAASKDADKALASVAKAGLNKYTLAQACETLADAAYAKGAGAEAQKFYELIVKDFADTDPIGPPLSQVVQPRLYELRHLWIGKKALDIVCPDPDGMPIKLSDFRGKVVLLHAWQSSMLDVNSLSLEKTLLTRFEGKPFICLSVSQDATAAQAKAAIQDQRITWPVMWDGGRGAVQRQWLQYSPSVTLYVIDAEGVIRARGNADPKLIDDLVMEASRKEK